jgi:hypothetical protein
MFFKSSALLLAAASLVSAQTPAGFVPEVSQNLPVKYGTTAVAQAGQRFPQPGKSNLTEEVAFGKLTFIRSCRSANHLACPKRIGD